jgi:DNA polymerase V
MIALVDCNNFYASCERVFRPDLTGQPIVVLSNNDGCIISRSNEAKEIGIPMGAPPTSGLML